MRAWGATCTGSIDGAGTPALRGRFGNHLGVSHIGLLSADGVSLAAPLHDCIAVHLTRMSPGTRSTVRYLWINDQAGEMGLKLTVHPFASNPSGRRSIEHPVHLASGCTTRDAASHARGASCAWPTAEDPSHASCRPPPRIYVLNGRNVFNRSLSSPFPVRGFLASHRG